MTTDVGSEIRSAVERSARVLSVVLSLLGAGCGGANPNVWTQHNDNLRTGEYLAEDSLTPRGVADRGMQVVAYAPACRGFIGKPPAGKRGGCIDGAIEAQPLFVRDVAFDLEKRSQANCPFEPGLVAGNLGSISTAAVFVATMSNKVYALSVGDLLPLWATDLMRNKECQELHGGYFPRGVAATPVIDVPSGRMYVVFGLINDWQDQPSFAAWRDPAKHAGAKQQFDRLDARYWLAVLDIRTGEIIDEVPISPAGFLPKNHLQHAALLLDHGPADHR